LGNVIGEILPLAVGVAVSPVPVIALILMLFSKRARSNGLAFAVSWVVGIAAVGAVVLALSGAGGLGQSGAPSTAAAVVKLLLGVLLLLLAVRQWQGRPTEGREAATPKWMQRIEGFTPLQAGGIAAALAAVNPKNLLLIVSAAVTVTQADLPAGRVTVAFAVFTVVASLTVILPVVAYLGLGDRAAPVLEELKTWLSQNNATVMAVLLLVLGVVLIGKGISGLTT
jgi:threonine/homoserine/homoserine lactone efflux protein